MKRRDFRSQAMEIETWKTLISPNFNNDHCLIPIVLLDDYNRTVLGSLKRVSEWLVSGFYPSRYDPAVSQNEEC